MSIAGQVKWIMDGSWWTDSGESFDSIAGRFGGIAAEHREEIETLDGPYVCRKWEVITFPDGSRIVVDGNRYDTVQADGAVFDDDDGFDWTQ